jgi:post-segregation antitoxin (ccd killing protein)
VNIYLPDELADQARAAGLNVSSITQEALRERLEPRRTSEWLNTLPARPVTGVTHAHVIEALDRIRAEPGDAWPDGPPSDAR